MSDSLKISLGVVGCGYIFRAVYAPVLKAMESRVQLTAVCDPDQASLNQALESFPGIRSYTDLVGMLEKETLDAVMVLTPERFNASVAIKLLDHGIPIYLEKPPAISLKQMDELAEKEQTVGVPVYTAFNRRFTPLMRDWKLPPDLKKVQGVLSRIDRPVENFPYTAVHLIDAAQSFGGSFFGDFKVGFKGRKNSGQWDIRGRMKSGVECELAVIPSGDLYEESLTFESDRGRWIFNFPNPEAHRHPLGRLVFQGKDPAQNIERTGEENNPQKAMGFTGVLDDFLSGIENGTSRHSVHGLSRCGSTIAVMEEMFRQLAR